MYCRICKGHRQEGSGVNGCGHYEPHTIYPELRKGKYVLMEKLGALRSVGRMRYWKPTKGMKFNDKESAIDYAWRVKNDLPRLQS